MPDEDRELNPIEKVVDKLGQKIPKLALFVEISTDIAPTVTWMDTFCCVQTNQSYSFDDNEKYCMQLKSW